MKSFTVFLFCLVLELRLYFGAVLTVPIEGKLEIPGGHRIPPNQELTLNGGQFSTLARFDGGFTFHDVPTGIYLLDVMSISELYPQMKIKVSAENGTVIAVEYRYPGAKRQPSSYPLVITAIAPVKYFKIRQPLSVYGIITNNPMIIMMLFSVIVVVAFPKMLSGMSPEELQELKKQSATSSGDPMKEFSKLMGMEEKTNEDEEE